MSQPSYQQRPSPPGRAYSKQIEPPIARCEFDGTREVVEVRSGKRSRYAVVEFHRTAFAEVAAVATWAREVQP